MPKKLNLKQRRKRLDRQVRAAIGELPNYITFDGGEPAQFLAAEAPLPGQPDGQAKPKVRSFSMTAYTGGAMALAGFYYPVVVDLTGLAVRSQTRPIVYSHDIRQIIGHSEKIDVTAQTIKVGGRVSGVGEAAKEVVALADNGFPWQSSIGADVQQLEFVERGNTVKVNGKNISGPVYVARKTSLREISFVALGADDNTSARIAAASLPDQQARRKAGTFRASQPSHKEPSQMNFSQWLAAKGFADEKSLNDEQRKILLAAYESETDPLLDDDDDTDPEGDPPAPAGGAGARRRVRATSHVPTAEEQLAELRRINAAEARRCAAIRQIVANYKVSKTKIEGDVEVDLEAHAIEQGWTAERVELIALRASRPTGPGIHVSQGTSNTQPLVIEAALALNARTPGVEKFYKPETLEAASRMRGFGLQQLLLLAAVAGGYSCRPGERVYAGNLRAVLEHAFPGRGIHAAGFSNMDVSGILSNVANKEILAGYMEEDQSWRELSVVKSVSDFKQATSYRLLDDMEYEELSPTGEIKHGKTSEETYTRQAKTYAKMLALTRTDIINDDMGAFADLRLRIGAGGAKKFNNVFWKRFLDNSAFFTTARGNYITGANTALGLDGVGLEAGVTAFRKMKSPTTDGSKKVGNAVGGRPEILLVPPELEFIAQRLHQSTQVNTGGSSTKDSVPDANVHAGKYRPVVVDWLSDSNFTGYSATAWYLFRRGVLAAMVVSFLDGQEMPTVESAEADFNQLGVQLRGYHDFGCDQAEYLAGVKSKGAA